MPVIYDSKKIIPAPIVSVNKTYQTTDDGTKIGATFELSIIGTLVAFKGSPLGLTSPGGASYGGFQNRFWIDSDEPPDETVPANQRLKSILAKQKALRDLFSTDGLSLEFTPLDGSTPMKCYPRIKNIQFSEGIWYDRCDYIINIEADCLLLDGMPICEDEFTEFIESGSESWTIDPDDAQPERVGLPRTYRMTHTVSAKGKRYFDGDGLQKPAWEQARDFVLPRLGIDSDRIFASGVLNLPSYYGGLNQVRNENVDEIGGTYSVTESWIISSGSALETFDVNKTTSADTGLTSVTIDGNITGLEQRDSDDTLVVDKYTNADAKFTQIRGQLLGRAQDYSGVTLNTIPLSTTVGKNPTAGTINYSFGYDTRPSKCITGALSESITVSNSWNADIFAAVFVLGREAGPVLQDLDAKVQSSRALNIELVMSGVNPGACTLAALRTAMTDSIPSVKQPTASQLQTIIDAANPSNDPSADANSQVFLADQNESWDFITGRYSYNAEWVYEL